jgi:hypothetical protein
MAELAMSGARAGGEASRLMQMMVCCRGSSATANCRIRAKGGVGRRLVDVVDDEDARLPEGREPGAEVHAGERGQVGQKLRHQARRRLAGRARGRRHGEGEMVEHARRIGVAGVDLVPERGEAPRLQPARD